MIELADIRKSFRGRIALNEPLSKYTSFRIGGPADYYFEPADREDLVLLIGFIATHTIDYTIVGNGSNLLVSDAGIRGAVINFEHGLNAVAVENGRILAEAGVRIPRFVDFCIQQGRAGVEMLAGIPGTIGGALIMNAGAHGGEISDYVEEIEILEEGQIRRLQKEKAGFAYRQSDLKRAIVLGAFFRLPEGDKGELMQRRRELLLKRNASQPLNFPNSGSVFKNPEGHHAAKLVEEAGLKGTRRGNAQISEKHGNFIVNLGGATAGDVIELMLLARSEVRKRSGISLELEVKLLGFEERVHEELHR